MPSATFVVKPYNPHGGGYEVHRTWPLDNGSGDGGCRVATFVDEHEANDYAKYRERMLVRNDTTEVF